MLTSSYPTGLIFLWTMAEGSPRRVVFALIRGSVQAAATITVATAGLREKSDGNTKVTVIAAAGLGVFILYDVVKVAIVERSASKRHQRESAYRDLLAVALLDIEELTSIPCSSIGVHLYERRWKKAPWGDMREGKPLRREMIRTCRYRVSSIPAPSAVRWTRSKGVVGSAWRTRAFAVADIESTEPSLVTLDEEQFLRAPAADRMGLKYGEFHEVVNRYTAIAAVPIVSSEGAVVGVVSLDVNYVGAFSLLNQPGIHKVLSAAAQSARSMVVS